MKDKRVFIVYLISVFLCIFVVYGGCIFQFLYKNSINVEIKETVLMEVNNLSTSREKTQKLAIWFNESNIKYVPISDAFFNFFRYPWCLNTPEMTFFTRKGRCGEWSSLFMKMLNYTNITNRAVRFVEDHDIVEVLVDGNWVPVEPSGGISSFDNYKTSKNISKAFVIYDDNKQLDVTINYAETGFLSVRTTERKIISSNSKVCVFSKNLMFSDSKNYKKPFLSYCNYTNEFGIHVENIGKGIYDIEALKIHSPFECSYVKIENYILIPNTVNKIDLELISENPFSCFIKFINGLIFS